MEDYILAENIIRIGTIHAAVPYTDTHKEEKIPIWNVKSVGSLSCRLLLLLMVIIISLITVK